LGIGEPEFEGAIERAMAGEGDAGESALDGGFEPVLVLRGGGGFEGKEGHAQRLRKERRGGQNVGEGTEELVVCRFIRRQDEVAGSEVVLKGLKESDKARVSDGLENGGVGDLGQCWIHIAGCCG